MNVKALVPDKILKANCHLVLSLSYFQLSPAPLPLSPSSPPPSSPIAIDL